MNWITKFIKPKIKSLFEKKSSKVEENLWTTCGCKNLIYKEDMVLSVIPNPITRFFLGLIFFIIL